MRLLLTAGLLVCLAVSLASAFQVPELSPGVIDGEKLIALTPRIEKQDAGYITIPPQGKKKGGEMFYWFFESRSDPDLDPLLIWLNGGPGCR